MMEARKRIVRDILEIWKGKNINNNKEYIPASLIIKSFKITGISNSNDGTEDYLFDGYDVINNLNILNEQNKDLKILKIWRTFKMILKQIKIFLMKEKKLKIIIIMIPIMKTTKSKMKIKMIILRMNMNLVMNLLKI